MTELPSIKSLDVEVDPTTPTHNYCFAHMLLRGMALSGARDLLTVLGEHGDIFLTTLWQRAGALTAEHAVRQSTGLHLELVREGPHHLAFIRLPAPERRCDAIEVLIACSAESAPRYLLVEYSPLPDNGEFGALLCEWTDHAHANLGQQVGNDPQAARGALRAQAGIDDPSHP